MDAYTYHNIFATKGMEYIVIIVFLLLCIPFWMALNKQSKVTEQFNKNVQTLRNMALQISQGLFYAKNHTWSFLEKNGMARVGLDELLFNLLGKTRVEYLKSPGSNVKKGEVIARLIQDEKVLNIKSPVSGEIQDFNNEITEDIPLSDFEKESAWLFTLKPESWKTEINNFLLGSEAENWMKTELNRLKDFLAESMKKNSTEPIAVAYQEGGEIQKNVLSEFDKDTWIEFQSKFLDS